MTKKIPAIHVTKKVAKRLITIDDDFYARYMSYEEIDDKLFSDSGTQWYHSYSYSYGTMSLKKEVYNWCVENKFRYRKIILIDDLKDGLQTNTTGILFSTTADAMAFKLRWL